MEEEEETILPGGEEEDPLRLPEAEVADSRARESTALGAMESRQTMWKPTTKCRWCNQGGHATHRCVHLDSYLKQSNRPSLTETSPHNTCKFCFKSAH